MAKNVARIFKKNIDYQTEIEYLAIEKHILDTISFKYEELKKEYDL